MSDLRVTDVQAALRHFAISGNHDLVTDPYKLNLDDKEYQSLHNTLDIRNVDNMFNKYDLTSYIGHGETPVISSVHSEGNQHGLWERSVGFLIPQLEHINGTHSSRWSPHYDDDEENGGWHKGHPSGFWHSRSFVRDWSPNNKTIDHIGRAYGVVNTGSKGEKTVDPVTGTHDMIARHAKGDVPYRGRYIPNGNYRDAVPLQREHFRHFNVEEATNFLTHPMAARYSRQTPNSIYVTHRGTGKFVTSTHVYDPDTEQLTQLSEDI